MAGVSGAALRRSGGDDHPPRVQSPRSQPLALPALDAEALSTGQAAELGSVFCPRGTGSWGASLSRNEAQSPAPSPRELSQATQNPRSPREASRGQCREPPGQMS